MNEQSTGLCTTIGRQLREAAAALAKADVRQINGALDALAIRLADHRSAILDANLLDMQAAERAQTKHAFLDRLRLDADRIEQMIMGVRAVREQVWPFATPLETRVLASGMQLEKRRVPLGVILFIYESRPNVTTDAAAICLKSANAICLRGGSEAVNTNLAIGKAVAQALDDAGLPSDAVRILDDPDRKLVGQLLSMPQFVDLVIPRGGETLIRRVAAEAKMPVLKHYQGVCHVYVDASADIAMAANIVENSKCQRPGVCNAMETLLVHQAIASQALPVIADRLIARKVDIRGCPRTCEIVPAARPAQPNDFGHEFLDLIVAVRVVDSLAEAIGHIAAHGSGHTDAIVAANAEAAARFLREVDSSVVLHNASTRFNDGGQLGLGAEIGISTDKLHARGPCGVLELTGYKYVLRGQGQIRS